jgi:hypothetical protein
LAPREYRLFALQDRIFAISVEVVSVHEIAEAVMGLPENDRLELARRIVESVISEQQSAGEVARAVRGIEDILTGKVRGLNEAEFQRALE